jgi:hypothetical protein
LLKGILTALFATENAQMPLNVPVVVLCRRTRVGLSRDGWMESLEWRAEASAWAELLRLSPFDRPAASDQFAFLSSDVFLTVALCCLPLESRMYILSPFTANCTGCPRVMSAAFDQGKRRCSLAT